MNKENQVYKYTTESLRNLQKKSLEIFKYLKKFCEENNLTIYFCGGCCIGAIRTKGFIPWDDDIDVFMPRESYNRLKEIWKEKADIVKYECVIPSEKNFTRNLFITVNDNNTTFIKTHQTDLDINLGIPIDILPLDGCPNSKVKRKLQKFWALVYSLYCAQMIQKNHGKFVEILGRAMLAIVPSKKIRWKIVRLAEKKMTKYKIEDCEYVTELCSGPKYMQNEYKKEWFAKAIYKEFEGEKMPIPIGYDYYLRMAFGDYMQLPPKEKQIPEHNVVYCDLENSYKKYKGIYYCKEKGGNK